MTRPSVIFDFDGTVALGDGPLEAYARSIGELTTAAVADGCRTAVRHFNSGTSDHPDGYAAVQSAALAHGVTREVLSAAYLRSREVLATDAAPIHAPVGLTDFMAELNQIATCVLATNSPETGLDRALATLHITGSVDEVHTSVGKPDGLAAIIARHLANGAVLAVGDIWVNDLAPAQLLGADTAFVGVGRLAGQPTLRGATLADLYDDILRWATQHTTTTGAARTNPRHYVER